MAKSKLYIVITKDSNGAPSEAYRGESLAKAEGHKKLLLKDGKVAMIEQVDADV